MTSPQMTPSARKIANYTQSISSGVTNLLTELGRVNATSSPDTNTNNAVLTQLQVLTTLVQDMSTRLAAVEQNLQKLDHGDTPILIEYEPEKPAFHPNITVEYVLGPPLQGYANIHYEYNSRARRHNKTARGGNSALMPLRTVRNTLVVGFPSTLGHLIFLDHTVELCLIKAFGLSSTDDLWTFIGSDIERARMVEYYSTGEDLAIARMEKMAMREREIAAAGLATAATKRAAIAHNRIARAANAKSDKVLMPIHDDRNMPVYGWPRTLQMLADQYRRWDALYLLAEYGESVKNKDDCMARLIKFIGVDQDTLYENCDFGLGVGEHGPYWLM